MEGYFVYTLFRGNNSDTVVEQRTGCGPECEQEFIVHVFKNGKLTANPKFEDLYPKKKLDKHLISLINKIPNGPNGETPQTWIRLPKFERSIDLLVVDQNPGATRGQASVYRVGVLTWNGNSFDFKKMSLLKPSNIKIQDVH
ncbi:MAG: hypothetical protein AABY64_03050 [Bdellovibrionota bacterium]